MRLPPFLLAVIGLFVVCSTAEAAKPLDKSTVLASGRARSVRVGVEPLGTPVCRLGVLPVESPQPLNFIFAPEDYYTLLTSPQCGPCALADTIKFTTVHIPIYFVAPCSLSIQVSVVGVQTFGGCTTFPDPGRVFYSPITYQLVGREDSTLIDFALTLPDTCRVTGKTFLAFRFLTGPPCTDFRRPIPCDDPDREMPCDARPHLLLHGGCETCFSYNDYDFDDLTNDLCGNIPPDEPFGNLIMYVDIDACLRIPPGRVTNLRATGVTDASVTLTWTAPLVSGGGPPATYLLRASTVPIDESNFDSAPLAPPPLAPTVGPGEVETYVFGGLEPGRRYWFAMKARDGDGNLSELSNLESELTKAEGPLIGRVGPVVISRTRPARLPVELYWQGDGTGAPQSIRIYDAFGALRRVLDLGTEVWGVARWDGRDEHGQLVFSGVYFARFRGGSADVTTRFPLLR